jgi:hypothetical protein
LFSQTEIPELGRCSSEVQAGISGLQMLKVLCESTGPIARATSITLESPDSSKHWSETIGNPRDMFRDLAPQLTWLSPLERAQMLRQIVDAASPLTTQSYAVPGEILKGARIRIEPVISMGCANISYTIDVPDLGRWRAYER